MAASQGRVAIVTGAGSAVSEFGRVDALVNNAGVARFAGRPPRTWR